MSKKMSRALRCALLTCLVVCVALGLIWASGAVPVKWTTFDLSENQLMTPSEEAAKVVEAVGEPVTMYLLASEANVDTYVYALLERYAVLSDKLSVKQVDIADAAFAARYTSAALTDNSVILESGRRWAVVSYESLYQYAYSYNYAYNSYVTSSVDLVADNALVAALRYVTAETLPTTYATAGHGETQPDGELMEEFMRRGMGVESLSLADAGEIPADAAAVFINSPTADLSEAEAALLLAYLKAGGNVILVTDCTQATMPNLMSVAAYYGMSAQLGIVLESTSGYYYSTYTQYLLPKVNEHEITATSLETKQTIAMPLAHGIVLNDAYRAPLSISALMTTSDGAFLKENVKALTTLDREDGDLSGPFVLAAAASETVGDATARLIWFASNQFLVDDSGTGNISLFGDALDWMADLPEYESIAGKSLMGQLLVIDNVSGTIWMCVYCVLPVGLLVAALVAWKKRRATVV